MTSEPSVNPPMQNATSANSTTAATSSTYRASVPISVYRELASELQSAQARVESIQAENQQLVLQNQQLRQEVEKVVQSALYLQQVVTSWEPVGKSEIGALHELPLQVRAQVGSQPAAAVLSGKLHTEQQERPHRRPSHPERASDVNGWLLAAGIFLILLTAFGAGLFIVRPMLKGR